MSFIWVQDNCIASRSAPFQWSYNPVEFTHERQDYNCRHIKVFSFFIDQVQRSCVIPDNAGQPTTAPSEMATAVKRWTWWGVKVLRPWNSTDRPDHSYMIMQNFPKLSSPSRWSKYESGTARAKIPGLVPGHRLTRALPRMDAFTEITMNLVSKHSNHWICPVKCVCTTPLQSQHQPSSVSRERRRSSTHPWPEIRL